MTKYQYGDYLPADKESALATKKQMMNVELREEITFLRLGDTQDESKKAEC